MNKAEEYTYSTDPRGPRLLSGRKNTQWLGTQATGKDYRNSMDGRVGIRTTAVPGSGIS